MGGLARKFTTLPFALPTLIPYTILLGLPALLLHHHPATARCALNYG